MAPATPRPPRPRRTRWLAAVLSVASAASLLAGPSTAQEAPSAGPAALPDTLAVSGHGWGHGRGMGQYGSLGYATGSAGAPWSHATILEHFYGGTTVGHLDNPLLAVVLRSRTGQAMVVYRAAGLQVLGQPDTPPAVRVTRREDGKYDLQTSTVCGGPWSTPPRVLDGPVRVIPKADSGTTALRLCNADGSAIAYHPSTELVASGAETVNLVHLEELLRGIVPRESPASWGDAGGGAGMAALRTQAVAARSYAAAGDTRWGDHHTALGATATSCDDQFCQVYGGIAYISPGGAVTTRTHPNTDQAIAETQNEIRRTSSGGVARTEFSSSTGGWTAGGAFPAVDDLGDAVSSNPNHAWSTSMTRSAIEAKYGLGTLTDIQFTSRNGLGSMGGRVLSVRLVGTAKSVDVTGNAFRSAFGLKSDWFNITVPPPPVREPRSISTACPSSQVTRGAFDDVQAGSAHALAIDCVAWRDIASGTGPRQFSPALDVTRGQMASFVARMITAAGGSLPSSPPNAFDDDGTSVHEHAIDQLAQLGIVNGTSSRTYQPSIDIDRAQLASILARALLYLDVPLAGSPPSAFSDDNDSVHEHAIDQLADEGVVAGTSPGIYQPDANARRDQMASFIARSLDLALTT
jgi:SpoIID/LytB domain protein